ncbi:MAG TPA: MFS transporter [Dehalococcoidia bacterium]|nr:MFS transporter [Dehalococcoidia bacterium]
MLKAQYILKGAGMIRREYNDLMLKSVYSSSNYKWLVFSAIGLGSLTNVIHHGSISIALPTIAREFDVSLTTIQWVVLAESLTISALLLPMGRLSDIIGRKPMYLLGVVLFGVMALFAGSSPAIAQYLGYAHPIMLMIPFRVFQGVGAAMTQANGMAMVTSIFSARERGKGLGAHGSVIGTGGDNWAHSRGISSNLR